MYDLTYLRNLLGPPSAAEIARLRAYADKLVRENRVVLLKGIGPDGDWMFLCSPKVDHDDEARRSPD